MRKLSIIVISLLLCVLANAQNSDNLFVSESKTYQFIETRGKFVQKEEFDKPLLTMIPAIITDLRTGEKQPYVVVRSGGSVLRRSVLDYEEIPAVIEALEYIKDCPQIKEVPDSDVEIYIKTRDGISLGVFIGYKGLLTSKKVWKPFIQQSRYLTDNIAVFQMSNLTDLIQELKDAKTLLDSKIK